MISKDVVDRYLGLLEEAREISNGFAEEASELLKTYNRIFDEVGIVPGLRYDLSHKYVKYIKANSKSLIYENYNWDEEDDYLAIPLTALYDPEWPETLRQDLIKYKRSRELEVLRKKRDEEERERKKLEELLERYPEYKNKEQPTP